MNDEEISGLLELPNEIITETLKKLPLSDLLQCYKTSKNLRANINDNILHNVNINKVNSWIESDPEALYRLALLNPKIATILFENPKDLLTLKKNVMISLADRNSKKNTVNLIPDLVGVHQKLFSDIDLRNNLISELGLYELITIIENDTSENFKNNPAVTQALVNKESFNLPTDMELRIAFDPKITRMCSDKQKEDAIVQLARNREELFIHNTENNTRTAISEAKNMFELILAVVQSSYITKDNPNVLEGGYYSLYKAMSNRPVDRLLIIEKVCPGLGIKEKYDELSVQATQDFINDIKNADSLNNLIAILKTAPIALTNSRDELINVDWLANTITQPQIDSNTITSRYGLRDACTKLRDKALIDFQKAVDSAASKIDIIEAIRSCPLVLTASNGNPLDKEVQSDLIMNGKPGITSKYNLRGRCAELNDTNIPRGAPIAHARGMVVNQGAGPTQAAVPDDLSVNSNNRPKQ